MDHLNQFIPKKTYAIAAGYRGGELAGAVAGAIINDDDSVMLTFPKANPFMAGQRVTLHLDNRTGVESFTPELRVYRCSYKGVVTEASEQKALVVPEEFILRHSNNDIIRFLRDAYRYPEDGRAERAIENTQLDRVLLPNENEKENKLGVWITRAVDRPHTTVMAFLSSEEDEIFVISHSGTFKSHNIHRDPRCLFAIDHRASYRFDKAIDWNYTIIVGEARIVPRDRSLFAKIQEQFIDKNPWELVFFTDPKVEMFHIRPTEILCQDKYAR